MIWVGISDVLSFGVGGYLFRRFYGVESFLFLGVFRGLFWSGWVEGFMYLRGGFLEFTEVFKFGRSLY